MELSRRRVLEMGVAAYASLEAMLEHYARRHEEERAAWGSPPRFSYPILRADRPNSNGHVYPRAVCAKLVEEHTAATQLYGQLGMPIRAALEIGEISHQVTALSWSGDLVLATVVPIPTNAGRRLRALLEGHPDGVAFRPYGLGCVETDGGVAVVSEYRLCSINAILSPEAARL